MGVSASSTQGDGVSRKRRRFGDAEALAHRQAVHLRFQRERIVLDRMK